MQAMIMIEHSEWKAMTDLVQKLSDSVDLIAKDRLTPETLTHKEAADYLGYSERRLHQLKDDRKVSFSQHSRKITYKLADLDEFLKEHRIQKRKT
ncbi:helix-turn-helix domain-containing protein [Dyadobacter sp. LHD-138]|uniref:helix-turn-helix domain-containing protein n=1 Tax=Dyadobacter sp. LHD-138 TaxID=3071413 RepID=UPI0027E0A53D|nr:helix-turn-helix domain-containing protein [Dyadobacter sp. LHD-138]MDQ6477838.1 helix-turn-helix domain-containing protein [Dyadobacter sp. LHD-138]